MTETSKLPADPAKPNAVAIDVLKNEIAAMRKHRERNVKDAQAHAERLDATNQVISDIDAVIASIQRSIDHLQNASGQRDRRPTDVNSVPKAIDL